MRALFVMLGAVAMLVGVAAHPASAGKGTDFDRFVKQIRRFASDGGLNSKSRGLCVCQNGGAHHAQAGELIYLGQLGDATVIVRCVVRLFNGGGDFFGASPCDTFEILSK